MAVQTKLTIGASHDPLEREADRTADQVMHMPAPPTSLAPKGSHPEDAQRQPEEEEEPLQAARVSRQISPEEEEEPIQGSLLSRTAPVDQRHSFEAGTEIEAKLQGQQGLGHPLSDGLRSFMEPRFGADFSDVRVHSDSEAVQMNREISARAFTRGADIYLGESQTNLDSTEGKHLMAHELTHVVQQMGAGTELRRVDTGLAVQKTLDKYGAKIKEVYDNWDKLSQENRLYGLVGAVNIELTKIRVPTVKAAFKACGGAGNAEFDFTVWTLNIDPAGMDQNIITKNVMAGMADSIYHESRHAEQWYRIARLRAGEGLTANQLEKDLFIPGYIASAAFADPLKPLGPEARRVRSRQAVELYDQSLKEAKDWYASVYGPGAAHREEVLGDIDNRYDEYRALAEEVDAWAVGTNAKDVVANLLGP